MNVSAASPSATDASTCYASAAQQRRCITDFWSFCQDFIYNFQQNQYGKRAPKRCLQTHHPGALFAWLLSNRLILHHPHHQNALSTYRASRVPNDAALPAKYTSPKRNLARQNHKKQPPSPAITPPRPTIIDPRSILYG